MSITDVLESSEVAFTTLTALLIAIVGFVQAIRKLRVEIKKLQQAILSTNAPEGDPPVRPDPSLVIRWAHDHRAENPWDLGPKNWERCLYDLGYPGGKQHELTYDKTTGKLQYQ